MNNIINKNLDDMSFFYYDFFIIIFIYKNECVCIDFRVVFKFWELGNYFVFNDDIIWLFWYFYLIFC